MYLVEKYQTMIAVPFFVVIYAVYEAIEKKHIFKIFLSVTINIEDDEQINVENLAIGEENREDKKCESKEPDESSKDIKCIKCGKQFRTMKNLKKHVRRFHGSVCFQCEVCDRFFLSEIELKRHMRYHLGYTCEDCNKVRI